VLDAVGDYFDGQFLGIADGFFARGTVRHDTRQFQSFRDPATIIFPIDFYGEVHNGIISPFRPVAAARARLRTYRHGGLCKAVVKHLPSRQSMASPVLGWFFFSSV